MPAKRLKAGVADSAAVFAALGDERRLSLVNRLCTDGPVSIAHLASGSDVSRQAIAKHLDVLARAGVVRGIRQGRERIYQVDARQVSQARQYLETITRQWDGALARLKLLVEENE